MKKTDTDTLLQTAIEAMAAKKGQDIVKMDLRGISMITDYFVICSGGNAPQIKAICDHVDDELGKCGVAPLRIEGYQDAHWVLMDYGDFVVHIFYGDDRAYYDLERLWGDCPMPRYDI